MTLIQAASPATHRENDSPRVAQQSRRIRWMQRCGLGLDCVWFLGHDWSFGVTELLTRNRFLTPRRSLALRRWGEIGSRSQSLQPHPAGLGRGRSTGKFAV